MSLVPKVGKTNYRDGGSRGGRDQFSWDNVAKDPQKSHFLGQSLHVQDKKKKDSLWWHRDGSARVPSTSSNEDAHGKLTLEQEKALLKKQEELEMAHALGVAPSKPRDSSLPRKRRDKLVNETLVKYSGRKRKRSSKSDYALVTDDPRAAADTSNSSFSDSDSDSDSSHAKKRKRRKKSSSKSKKKKKTSNKHKKRKSKTKKHKNKKDHDSDSSSSSSSSARP